MYEIGIVDDVCVARFKQPHLTDVDTQLDQMKAEITQQAPSHEAPALVLNFEGVEFMNSSTMGWIVSMVKQFQDSGGEVRLCNMSPILLELMRITRLDKITNICDSEQEAIDSFFED